MSRPFYDIDTPVTLAKLERGDDEYLSAEIIPGYDLYLSFTGGPILDHLVRRYGARAARALYCSVDETAYQPVGTPQRWGPQLSRHLQPRPPAHAGPSCCWNPPAARHRCASPSPGRNTRTP